MPHRTVLTALAISVLSCASFAQQPKVPPTDQCTNGSQQHKHLYEVSVSSGSPVLVSPEDDTNYIFKNDTNILVRTENINPFSFKCSVTTTSQTFQENAIGSFLGLIGGIADVGASTPKAASPTPAATSSRSDRTHPDDCYRSTSQSTEVGELQALADAINLALEKSLEHKVAKVDEYNKQLLNVRGKQQCDATVSEASTLAAIQPFVIEPAKPLHENEATAIPLAQAIDQIAQRAQTLLANLTDNLDPECKKTAKPTIDQDSAFLAAVAHGTTAVPAAADQWRAQLSSLISVSTTLANAQKSVRAILGNRQNFTIDTQIHGNQQTITVKVSCSPVEMQDIAATSGAASPAAKAPVAAQEIPPAQKATSDWSHDFQFSPGSRFVLSGGIVVSPLSSITYSTSANQNTGSGGTKPPPNIVVLQQNSSTRILPIGMLHGRFWDQLPANHNHDWLPNYLSLGVTAKSDAPKGTSIEYLFGPSWAIAARQLFITVGAYAGQQQRLGGGLLVGDPTSLSSTNLPITQKTIWKVGFAVTWAPAGK